MFGGLLAIDMGGYQLAKDIAVDAGLGAYAGIVVAATFGRTFIFTIPVGMRMLEKRRLSLFLQRDYGGPRDTAGRTYGRGLICGFSVFRILHQNGLILIVSLLFDGRAEMAAGAPGSVAWNVCIGDAGGHYDRADAGRCPVYDRHIGRSGTLSDRGSHEGGCSHWDCDARQSSGGRISAVYFKKPFGWLGGKIGLNEVSVAGLFVGTVSVLPQLTMLKNMDRLGKIVNTAYIVSAASMFAAHIGFTMNVQPDLLGALIAAKLTGGFYSGASGGFSV